MSAPILYIVVPMAVALAAFFVRRKAGLALGISLGLYLLLGLLAFFQEFGAVVKLGPISFDLGTSMAILGRAFVLSNADRYFLVISSVVVVLWLGGVRAAGLNAQIVPYILLTAASLTAAIAVEPFLYSAVFMEMSVLFLMPVFITGNEPLRKGVLRFLIFQSLAMPLILLGGWFIAGNQASPSDLQQLLIAAFFLGVGFAFWLAAFPFHSWVPQLAEEIHPYLYGFVLTLFPQAALLVVLDFTTSITWIRESSFLSAIFLSVGVIMLVAAAVLGNIEKKVQRLFGDLILYETGALLILIGLQTTSSLQAFYLSLTPRLLAIIIASLCISIIGVDKRAEKPAADGNFWHYPFASLGFLISLFSIVGLPPLGEFPSKLILISSLGGVQQINNIWVIGGFIGMALPLFRVMRRTFVPASSKIEVHESLPQIVLICIGIFLLLLMGTFPRVISSLFTNLLQFLPAGG